MKETARSATRKAPKNSTRSHSTSTANYGKDASASVHRAPNKRVHAAEAEQRDPRQRVRATGAEKQSHKRRTHVTELKNWVPRGPVHIGGVRNPGSAPQVHFAGVENRSPAAHLNDFHAELHPQRAASPLPGLFPVRRKQP